MTKILSITNRKEQTFDVLIPDSKYDEVLEYSWHIVTTNRNGSRYVARTIANVGCFYLHWQIMSKPERGMCIDHRDGNGLNNTSENLRLCTKQQNCINRGAQRNNTSGYKGVSWNTTNQRWHAQGRIGGKIHCFGTFDNPYEAHLVYCDRMKAAHGDYFNPGQHQPPTLTDVLSMLRLR